MPEEGRKYSMKEIAKHSTEESTWVLIDGEVYDVTKFLTEHPGGAEVLLEFAGKDATEAFEDVGHSDDAKNLMEQFKIGELDEEEPKDSSKPAGTTSKGCCCTSRVLIPIGIAVAAFILYRLYVHMR